MIRTILWADDAVVLIDQKALPGKVHDLTLTDWRDVVKAINDLTIRGAPAIGVAAAMGIALGTLQLPETSLTGFRKSFEGLCKAFAETRPTARNLFWAIERMQRRFAEALPSGIAAAKKALVEEAIAIGEEDIEINRSIGLNGKAFIRDGDNILTHCNAGALATAGYGTALGVIRAAREDGKNTHVFVDETRPLLQGARLTAWELMQRAVPCTLICDSMAAQVMREGRVTGLFDRSEATQEKILQAAMQAVEPVSAVE